MKIRNFKKNNIILTVLSVSLLFAQNPPQNPIQNSTQNIFSQNIFLQSAFAQENVIDSQQQESVQSQNPLFSEETEKKAEQNTDKNIEKGAEKDIEKGIEKGTEIAEETSKQTVDTETETKEIKVKDLDIEPINTQSVKQDIIPNPKAEGKKVIGLFIKTMFLTLLCGVFIYGILFFIKKFWGDIIYKFSKNNQDDNEVMQLDLSTPTTKQDALKSFLNKTR